MAFLMRYAPGGCRLKKIRSTFASFRSIAVAPVERNYHRQWMHNKRARVFDSEQAHRYDSIS
jgi:hypothetical protein